MNFLCLFVFVSGEGKCKSGRKGGGNGKKILFFVVIQKNKRPISCIPIQGMCTLCREACRRGRTNTREVDLCAAVDHYLVASFFVQKKWKKLSYFYN